MSLEAIKAGNAGGSGLNKILAELQGLTVSVIGTGATAGTKMNVAALRSEDTLKAAIAVVTATNAWSDDLANVTIVDTHASGTISLSTVVVGNTVTVNGVTYTFQAGAAATLAAPYTNVNLGTTDTHAAANLAAAINAVESTRATGGKQVSAVAAIGVVTVTAAADGVAGNSIAMTKVGSPITLSGSVLAGGTATGGVKSTTNLSASSLLLVWFNKR